MCVFIIRWKIEEIKNEIVSNTNILRNDKCVVVLSFDVYLLNFCLNQFMSIDKRCQFDLISLPSNFQYIHIISWKIRGNLVLFSLQIKKKACISWKIRYNYEQIPVNHFDESSYAIMPHSKTHTIDYTPFTSFTVTYIYPFFLFLHSFAQRTLYYYK